MILPVTVSCARADTSVCHLGHLPHSVPQILINRDPITHANFDIHLLGDADTIVRYLCDRLGPSFNFSRVPVDGSTEPIKPHTPVIAERVADSHVWLFPGANGGKWVEAVRKAYEDNSDEPEEEEHEPVGDAAKARLTMNLELPSDEHRGKSRSRTRSSSPPDDAGGTGKKVRID